jgi:hypothetical protein
MSRLFTKAAPAGLSTSASGAELMNAFWNVYTGPEGEYDKNLKDIRDQFVRDKIPMPEIDFAGVATAYRAFYMYGPAINYGQNLRLTNLESRGSVTWADLMRQTSSTGESLSFLGSEERFQVVKDLHMKHMIVPAVGNFAGPKALRAVGAYLREHGATVSAFYVSNVEQYLRKDNLWVTFCTNVGTMPIDATSVFIRPSGSYATRITGNGPLAPLSAYTPPGSGRLGSSAYVPVNSGSSRTALWAIADDVRDCANR